MGMTLEEYESNDLMAENEFLRKQLAEALKHRRMFEADYENRLKADLKAILVELQVEIDELRAKKHFQYKHGQEHGLNDALELIQQKINELKQESTTKNNLGVDAVSRADAISRKEVINQIFYSTDNNGDVVLGSDLRRRIERIPPTTPQEPTGKNFTKADIDTAVKAINEVWELRVNEILGMIRAEIETKYGQCKLTEYIVQYDGICTGANDIGDIADILQIIDKHKAESEDV